MDTQYIWNNSAANYDWQNNILCSNSTTPEPNTPNKSKLNQTEVSQLHVTPEPNRPKPNYTRTEHKHQATQEQNRTFLSLYML